MWNFRSPEKPYPKSNGTVAAKPIAINIKNKQISNLPVDLLFGLLFELPPDIIVVKLPGLPFVLPALATANITISNA